MPLGLYISVPFCRTKCTYCNFASDVFAPQKFEPYILRVCQEIERVPETVQAMGGILDRKVDAIYLGGGTPTLLDGTQLERLFVSLKQNFEVETTAEITLEAAPGTLSWEMVEQLHDCGVNRVSLGVQSFIDRETAAIGRLHKRHTVGEDILRLRAAGITNINIDLIAGLPHQTHASWRESLDELLVAGVPHASVYMLEVDQDSRLGRELLAGGKRYHSHAVPDDNQIADFYEIAVERLARCGLEQYEISNFAFASHQAKQNLKYWTRQPYLGFGVDAHSMMPSRSAAAVRFSNPDSLEEYLRPGLRDPTYVTQERALEETLFLGLRLNRGLNWADLVQEFGRDPVGEYQDRMAELVALGLVIDDGCTVRLTAKGRLLSNEVFEQFVSLDSQGGEPAAGNRIADSPSVFA
jgi:oxygen-independent coproporphyrinogen III oxidase